MRIEVTEGFYLVVKRIKQMIIVVVNIMKKVMMNNRIWILLGIFLFLAGCNRQKTDYSISKITSDNNTILIDSSSNALEQGILIEALPKIMYVNSREGLRIRSKPYTG